MRGRAFSVVRRSDRPGRSDWLKNHPFRPPEQKPGGLPGQSDRANGFGYLAACTAAMAWSTACWVAAACGRLAWALAMPCSMAITGLSTP